LDTKLKFTLNNIIRKKPFRVAVIGGGISGLSSAHHLAELSLKYSVPLEIIVLEKSGKLGGVISSKSVKNFIIEEGPDSFNINKHSAIDLCHRIGMNSDIIHANDKSKQIFVIYRENLLPIPEGFLLAPTRLIPFLKSPLFSLKGKMRILMDIVIPRRNSQKDESVASFIKRRFGKEAFKLVVQPLFSGIYSTDPDMLSMQATMPHFIKMEQEHGSIIWAMRSKIKFNYTENKNSASSNSSYVSFKRGMQDLVNTLASYMPKESIQLNKIVQEITLKEDGWKIVTSNNNEIDVNGVIIATPSIQAATFVRGFDPLLADYLLGIKYTSSVIINLVYKREDIPHPLNGSGFVVPKSEDLPILACTFSSVKFPRRTPPGMVLLRCYMGGDINSDIYEEDDTSLNNAAHKSICGVLGIRSKPIFTMIRRNPQSMPQYTVGHLDHISQIYYMIKKYPGLQLAGNAYEGVGIPDCIRSGENAAEKLFEFIQHGENIAN